MTRYAKTNHYTKNIYIYFYGFRFIFVGSIIVANLKYISCFLLSYGYFLCRFPSSEHCESGELYLATRFLYVSVIFLRDTLLRVKDLSLTVSRGSGFLRNLFYLLTSVSVEVLLSRRSREQGLKES